MLVAFFIALCLKRGPAGRRPTRGIVMRLWGMQWRRAIQSLAKSGIGRQAWQQQFLDTSLLLDIIDILGQIRCDCLALQPRLEPVGVRPGPLSTIGSAVAASSSAVPASSSARAHRRRKWVTTCVMVGRALVMRRLGGGRGASEASSLGPSAPLCGRPGERPSSAPIAACRPRAPTDAATSAPLLGRGVGTAVVVSALAHVSGVAGWGALGSFFC